MGASRVVVLAPVRLRGGNDGRLARLLARADHWPRAADMPGHLYADLFLATPAGWPEAALTRQLDAGDAGDTPWLRADPAFFRAETANVRLLAFGAHALGLNMEQARALQEALAPLFGDEGFELSVPVPDRWYLRPFAGNAAPEFPDLPPVEDALGRDLFDLWPEDDIGWRWRRLFSEVQIVLANHPLNRQRAQAGRPPVNGLWFHGGGRLPRQVRAQVDALVGGDALLRALAQAAGITPLQALPADRIEGRLLLDLRADASPLPALLEAWQQRLVDEIEWRAPDGRWLHRRWHRWRFWRR